MVSVTAFRGFSYRPIGFLLTSQRLTESFQPLNTIYNPYLTHLAQALGEKRNPALGRIRILCAAPRPFRTRPGILPKKGASLSKNQTDFAGAATRLIYSDHTQNLVTRASRLRLSLRDPCNQKPCAWIGINARSGSENQTEYDRRSCKGRGSGHRQPNKADRQPEKQRHTRNPFPPFEITAAIFGVIIPGHLIQSRSKRKNSYCFRRVACGKKENRT